MAHILVIELPGGNDPDVLHAAREAGHDITFLTADLSHYLDQVGLGAWLMQHVQCVQVPELASDAVLREVERLHARQPFGAVICLIDARMVLAADIAQHLGLPFLDPGAARLMRHKHHVRERLRARGLPQPAFALAVDAATLHAAVDRIGLPVIIKPVDGSGSTDIVCLEHPDDLAPWMSPLPDLMPYRADYGLGVRCAGQLLVERKLSGQVVGMDIFSAGGRHQLLGCHVKRFFPAPSFAIAGGTFLPWHAGMVDLARQAYAVLDALGFDWGASHSEWVLNDEGLHLIEVNPRLVGARLPMLVELSRQRRLTAELIDLHLGTLDPVSLVQVASPRVAVSRWIASDHAGILEAVEAHVPSPGRFIQTRRPGDRVRPPMENADRIGCVMVAASTAAEAEQQATALAAQVQVRVRTPDGLARVKPALHPMPEPAGV